MKKFTLTILIPFAALLLGGCLVTSVCPFYADKDLVFEPRLVGDWVKAGDHSDEVWKFQKSGEKSYHLTLIEPNKATVLEARTFKLEGQLFMDIGSIDTDVSVIPPHYLLRVDGFSPTLVTSQLDNDWLRTFLAKNPQVIAHHLVKSGDNPDELRVVLRANTLELQKFVLEHLKTKSAWDNAVELKPEPVQSINQQAGK